MSESKLKVNLTYNLNLSDRNRYFLFQVMSPLIQCHGCGSGPVDTKDPRKIEKYNRLFDKLNLEEFDNIDLAKLEERLIQELKNHTAPKKYDLSIDLLKYLYEMIVTRSYLANGGIVSCIDMVTQIEKQAKDSNTTLMADFKKNEITISDEEDIRELEITVGMRQCIYDALINPTRCKHQLDGINNITGIPVKIIHNQPMDGPKTIPDIQAVARAWDDLNLVEFDTADSESREAVLRRSKESAKYQTDLGAVKYICDLLVKRAENVANGQRRFWPVIELLEGIKNGDGKIKEPVAVVPEAVAG